MSTLLKNLGFDLSYPLHDATGLAGQYKIDLSWIPTESPPGTLFVEMEKTAWSLRVEGEGKSPGRNAPVIDHIEKKPSGN